MAFRNLNFYVANISKPRLIRYKHTEAIINVFHNKINYIQAGDGERTILLMPGALGTAWTDFRPQIEELPKLLPNHTLFAWDPPGCGKSINAFSEQHGFNMFENQANCAIDLMQALKRDNFSVLGWNTGGTSALIMAGRFPQFVDKIVVWGSSAYITADEIKKLDEMRGVSDKPDDFGKKLQKHYGKKKYQEFWTRYISKIEKVSSAQKGNICKTELECIQAPTLVLRGGNDPIISLEHVEYLLRHIKNAKFQDFPEDGHDIHLKNSAAFNKHVSNFLLQMP